MVETDNQEYLDWLEEELSDLSPEQLQLLDEYINATGDNDVIFARAALGI